ncbi:hypothetical protein SASPL_148574 [Salvia splendens]|uniref:Uncharacterized protein n=1 Tax=Salvia splendens TaxID=180675 RepID=A0A8X8WAI4_SALSN|nr:hypothetical protein SASPL_148574 [Salvia splendens]
MKRVWKCRRKGLGSVVVRRIPRCHRWSASATAAVVGLRYRGNSLGLSSVSNFRTGRMPSVNRMIENLSDWDIDTSDSEGGGYGGRDSPKASLRDDKVANGGARHIYFSNAPGNYNDSRCNWYAVLSYDASVRLCLHSWARSYMRAPPFLENECSLLRDVLEEKLTRKDHSELVGEGAYVKSMKTIGKIRVQVRNVKMGTKQPTGFTFTSLKSSSTVKLETFQQRIIFLYVEIEKFVRRGCIGNATGTCLPGGFGDDLNLNYIVGMFLFRWLTFLMNWGRSVVSVLYPGKKSMKKLRKIQLYINYSTTADKDSYKIPSFGESGITNYVLRPVHICSRNYRLRLCFGDCDERPTVSAQKLVATWFVEMVGGFICIFSGVLDAYTKLRYLSYVMDISTATVDYLDLVHDILLPMARFLGEVSVSVQIEQILTLVFENFKLLREKGNWYAVLSYDASVRLCLHSWARSYMRAPPFLENECSLLRDVLEEKLTRKDHSELVGEGAYVKSKKTIGKIRVQVRNVKMGTKQPTGFTFTSLKSSSTVKLETFQQRIIFLYVEIEKFVRRGCIGNATGTCLPGGFGDDLNLNYIVGMFLFRWLTFLMNWGRSVVSVLYPGKKSMKKLRKIQLHINYSTTADKDSYKIPSFGESGITNYVLRPVHICSRNYRLRLCFGDCDERPTVSAQKLVATWFVEMVGGFICIFSGVLDAYTKLRYLSYVMDISTATVDYLDLVHDILLPMVIKDKRFAAPALDPALKLYKWLHDILSPRLLREKGNWYAVLSYDASVRLCLHSWARSYMRAPPFLENECSLLRDVLEEKLTRKDHSELVGEGAYVKSKKTIGKIRVQVRNVKMGTKQPTGFTFTSLKSSSTVKLETFQQRIIFLYVEIEKFVRRGCIGNATGTCLPGGFGDDLNLNYIVGMFLFRWLTFLMNWGRSVVSVLYPGKKSMKKLRKIQLHINYSTTADKDSYKIPSFGESGITNYVLRPVHICSRNYRLRLCFGDCDERPTVSAQKLVATWFVEMVGGFICIFSGVLDAYTKLRYLSYVMDISTATVDYLDLVHDILLPMARFLGEVSVSVQIEQILTLVFENFKLLREKGNWYAVLSYDASVRLCLHSWARSYMRAPPFLENECSLLRDVLEEKLTRKDHSELVGEGAYVKSKKTIGKIRVQVRNVKMGTKQPTGFTFTSLKSSSTVKLETFQQRIIFLYVEIEKFVRRGCIGNATGTCLPGGFGDDLNLNYIVGMFLFRWLTFLMNWGRSVVSVLYPGKKSMKKLRKIQLYINYSTTADKDSYKIPSFGESGITNYVLRPVHICSRNYRLRLCFGDCDERPTVSAQKLVATWFVEMVGGFICIFSGVLDAYTKLRYLSYVMDISTATVDYLDLVHDILLPVASFLGEVSVSVQIEQMLTLVFENFKLLREKGNWYAVLSYDASVRLCLHSWARSYMRAPPFLENECSLLRDVLGAYVKSKKTIGKIRVQVRNVKMGTKQPTGFTFTSLKSSSTVKLETFQQRIIFLYVEIEKFVRRGCIGNATGTCLPGGFGDDLNLNYIVGMFLFRWLTFLMNWGRSVVSVLYPGKKSMKKLRKIQLYINYSTTADKDSYKIPSFGESGITNYVLRPVHICSRNYRLRLCFGDCDERPTVSAQKLVATWFVEMVGGFICIFSGVLDAYTKLRYLSYVMDISTATVDYLDLVHDILLPVASFLGEVSVSVQIEQILTLVFENFNFVALQMVACYSFPEIATRKRSIRHLFEIDEFFSTNNENIGLGNWYAVLSYDASVRLCLHSWARSYMRAPPFLENECSLLRDVLEEKLTRKDHSELVGEGAYVKSKKTIGKIRVQVRNVKMGTKQPTGFTFTSLKSSSTVKLETFQQRIIFLYVEIEKFVRRGCIGNATGTCLPGGFGDDLNLNYIVGMFLFRWLTFLMNWGRSVVSVLYPGKKSMKKLRKIQLYINYSTTADKDSYKIPSFGESGITNYVLRPVHICSRNYRLRLCFGDCDERPTVSAQKLVATWFVEMVGGFICIFSGVLDAYTKLRYLSYVMDISTATVDYLDLVHDILLPVASFLGEVSVSVQIEQILTLVFENFNFVALQMVACYSFPEVRLKLYCYEKRSIRHLFEIDKFFSTNNENIGLGNWYAVLSYDASVRLCLHSWARSYMRAPPFLENECSLLRDVLEEKLTRKDHSELVGEGAYVKSKKTIGKIRVQVRNVKMGTKQPTGFTFTSLKSSSTVKLETFQQSASTYELVQESYSCMLRLKSSSEEDALGMQPGPGEARVADISDELGKKRRQNYRLRLCFGDCDERPTVSAQKLVATWFVEMVGGFICIFSGVLDAYTKLRYLSYVMDISTATVDYLDLVHDILLPVASFLGEVSVSVQIEQILTLVFENFNFVALQMVACYSFPEVRLKLYCYEKKVLSEGLSWMVSAVDDFGWRTPNCLIRRKRKWSIGMNVKKEFDGPNGREPYRREGGGPPESAAPAVELMAVSGEVPPLHNPQPKLARYKS